MLPGRSGKMKCYILTAICDNPERILSRSRWKGSIFQGFCVKSWQDCGYFYISGFGQDSKISSGKCFEAGRNLATYLVKILNTSLFHTFSKILMYPDQEPDSVTIESLTEPAPNLVIHPDRNMNTSLFHTSFRIPSNPQEKKLIPSRILLRSVSERWRKK
jgi:hypothetical protein